MRGGTRVPDFTFEGAVAYFFDLFLWWQRVASGLVTFH